MPTGFHPNPHFFSAHLELGRTAPLPRGAPVSARSIHPCPYRQAQSVGSPGDSHNLIMIMFGSFLPTTKVYSRRGSQHCYGIITLIAPLSSALHIGELRGYFSIPHGENHGPYSPTL